MNEFGEIAIDTKVIEGKNVRIAELGGGCVCCSLLGEFEAAVNEIIEKIAPERIVVETTGLAEPEALVFNIQEALPQCRLDGVVSVIDADMLIRFPELGHTTRLQIEGADILLLNKIDLIEPGQVKPLETKLREINPTAAIVRTERCRIDPELLFGIGREREIARAGTPASARIRIFRIHFQQNFFSRLFRRLCKWPAGERGSREGFHPLRRWRAAFQFRGGPLGTGAI